MGFPLAADGVFGSASAAAVRHARHRLGDWGWLLVPDGLFGAKTHAAVCDVRRGNALDVDGLVGPGTWDALWRPVS